MRTIVGLIALAACGTGSPKPETPAPVPSAAPPEAVAPWRIPAGWRSETIPFPLDFAPSLAHRGVEELRFAPGMFDPKAPGYWSYAFLWRTEDAAALDADALAAELTTYFRGLLAAVDKERGRIKTPEAIVVRATATGTGTFSLTARVFDAFGTGLAVDLTGNARRTACGAGALWTIVLAPASSTLRAELDALAAEARCGQPLPPAPPSPSP